MKKNYLVIIAIVFSFISLNIYSQVPDYGNGPGGIGTKDGTTAQPQVFSWLRADIGVDTDPFDNYVITWNDQTGNDKDATDVYSGQKQNTSFTIKQPPYIVNNKMGGMPALKFYDKDIPESYSLSIPKGSSLTLDGGQDLGIWTVLMPADTSIPDDSDFQQIIQKRHEGIDDENARAFTYEIDGGARLNALNVIVNRNKSRSDIGGSIRINEYGKPYITSINMGDGAGVIYIDGEADGSGANYSPPFVESPSPTVIGQNYRGYISEVIFFKDDLITSQIDILNNSLAAKYGIDLNYSTYNKAANKGDKVISGCKYDMVGVGRGFDTDDQHSASKGGGVILELDTLDPYSQWKYAFLSHDDSASVESTEDQVNGIGDWYRTWYLQNPNKLEINLYFDYLLTHTDAPTSLDASEYKLYYAEDDQKLYKESGLSATAVDNQYIKFEIPDMYATFNDNVLLKLAKIAAPDSAKIGPFSPSGEGIERAETPHKIGFQVDDGSDIYYTTDGSEPVPGDDNTMKYTDSVDLGVGSHIVKAVSAFEASDGDGYFVGDIVEAKYTFSGVGKCYPVEFDISSMKITEATDLTMSSFTDGATIYYTLDGSEPTTSSNEYSGPVTIDQSGVVVVKAIATATGLDNSVVDSITVKSSIDIDVNYEVISKVNLYPNPADSYVNVEYTLEEGGEVEVTVYNFTGKTIINKSVSSYPGFNSDKIDLYTLKNGIYLLEVKQGDDKIVKKFIKQ